MNFKEEVAIVTGAGGGLGRSHALALAQHGARVVVNDVGAAADGGPDPADRVVREIAELGGTAAADKTDVTDADAARAMVERTVAEWGRIDILINNAGILRDRSFGKMDLGQFRAVLDVHLMGSVHCTQAVWPHMRRQQYGRVLMTTSGSGIYGNFGQANYGAAKAGIVGLMNVLAIEGERHGIRVNSLAPTAATAMTQGLFDERAWEVMSPESITPGALFLVSGDAPTKTILGAGGGVFAVAEMIESEGVHFAGEELTPESIAAKWDIISDTSARVSTGSAFDQTQRYLDLTAMSEAPSAPLIPSDLSVTAKVQS